MTSFDRLPLKSMQGSYAAGLEQVIRCLAGMNQSFLQCTAERVHQNFSLEQKCTGDHCRLLPFGVCCVADPEHLSWAPLGLNWAGGQAWRAHQMWSTNCGVPRAGLRDGGFSYLSCVLLIAFIVGTSQRKFSDNSLLLFSSGGWKKRQGKVWGHSAF